MNPFVKLHLGSAGFCGLLISLNWFRAVEYSRSFGVKSESFAPAAFALLLSAGAALYLGWLCVRSALAALEAGRKVREGRWIESRGVILYALPLLWHRSSSSTWIEPDGALATATSGYGHASSTWIFVFAIASLLLFQILMRLTSDDGADPSGSHRTRSTLIRA